MNVGDLINRLAGLSDAQLAHLTRRAGGLSGGAAQAWGLAVGVLEMRAALKAADRHETKKASDSVPKGGGEMSKKPLTGSSVVMDTIRTVARHTKRQGESEAESISRVASENPSLSRQYTAARAEEQKAGIPPESVRPTRAKDASLDPLIVERMALEAEIRADAEACGQDYVAFCTEHPEGRERYAVLDMMGKRAMSRSAAEQLVGKE